MFEFDKYDGRHHSLPPAKPHDQLVAIEGIEKVSFLVWGEHCIECAAPDCFASCDLYDARADLRCRRFEFGIFRNRNFRSLYGFGAEVVFKTWARLRRAATRA